MLKTTIDTLKSTKSSMQERYVRITDECRAKQRSHDASYKAYAEAVKQAEVAIQTRDHNRNLPQQQQSKFEQAVTKTLTSLNAKHDEYRRAVQVLKDAQVKYDAEIIDIMQQFERVEVEPPARLQRRPAALHRRARRAGAGGHSRRCHAAPLGGHHRQPQGHPGLHHRHHHQHAAAPSRRVPPHQLGHHRRARGWTGEDGRTRLRAGGPPCPATSHHRHRACRRCQGGRAMQRWPPLPHMRLA